MENSLISDFSAMNMSNHNFTQNQIDKVPNEIVCHILKYLSSDQDNSNCFNVCQRWRNLIKYRDSKPSKAIQM